MRSATMKTMALAGLMMVLAACSDEGTTGPGQSPAPVASVSIQPVQGTWTGSLTVGQTIALAAKPRAADGTELPASSVQWETTNSAVLTVSAAGMVEARSAGTAEVLATVRGKLGRQFVTVVAAPATVARVAVSPGGAVLQIGETRQYIARAFDAADGEIHGRVVEWISDAPEVATVTPGGVVVAVKAGYGQITAKIDGVSGTVALTVPAREAVRSVIVSPSPTSVFVNTYVQLNATVIGPNGGDLPGRTVTWASENPEIAMVGINGQVLGVKKGTARIRAMSEGVSGYATVQVRELATGPVQTYDLAGTLNLPVPYIQIGQTTWTDPANGVVRDAMLIVTGGTLRLDYASGTYAQTFTVGTYLSGGPLNAPPVRTEIVADQGRIGYEPWTGTMILESTIRSGVLLRPQGHGAGEYVIQQGLLGQPGQPWLWVIR